MTGGSTRPWISRGTRGTRRSRSSSGSRIRVEKATDDIGGKLGRRIIRKCTEGRSKDRVSRLTQFKLQVERTCRKSPRISDRIRTIVVVSDILQSDGKLQVIRNGINADNPPRIASQLTADLSTRDKIIGCLVRRVSTIRCIVLLPSVHCQIGSKP